MYRIFFIIIIFISAVDLIANDNLMKSSIAFEENKGQLTDETGKSSDIKFRINAGNFQVFIKNNGLSYQYERLTYKKDTLSVLPSIDTIEKTETHRVDMVLVNANPNTEISTYGKSEDYTNYYTHNVMDVHYYQRVVFHNVYPNIDWELVAINNELKYNFIVHSGGDFAQIKMNYSGQDSIRLDSNGNLILYTQLKNIVENKPIAFQEKVLIPISYNLTQSELKFECASYDKSKTFIIDPKIEWGTYHIGFGRFKSKHDKNQNIYICGDIGSNTQMAFLGHQLTYGGGSYDIILVKFDPNGNRKWSTYYGGNGIDYDPNIIIDEQSNIYLGGWTNSTNNISFNGYQANRNGNNEDGFIAKLDSSGSRLWGTYFGGSLGDQVMNFEIDDSSNLYVVGWTNSRNFPTLFPFKSTVDSIDGFIAKFNASGGLLWSTYYGGNYLDYITSISIDKE